MALITNELYSENSRGASPRVQPADGPGSLVTKEFKADAGAALLVAGTMISIEASSGLMIKTVPAGTAHASAGEVEKLYGIVWPADVQLSASGSVNGTVMLKGQVHIDDLRTIHDVPSTISEANLLLTLRNPVTRTRGLHIDGLTLADKTP